MSAESALRLRGARAGNLRDVDLELPLGAWTAVHGPSGAGKSALLFRVLEPVARRRFRVLEDPRAVPGGEEAWLRALADEVEGLPPVIASAGEIPRGRRGVLLGTALDLWSGLARAWEEDGGHACLACGERWRPPAAPRLHALEREFGEDERMMLLSEAGGAPAAELLQAGWTRVRAGRTLLRLEEAEDALPPDAWLVLDRFRWSTARRGRYREALKLALARGRSFVVEAGARRWPWPGAARCPACGAQHRSHARADWARDPGLEDRWIGARGWRDWCAAPLSAWRELPLAGAPRAARAVALLARTGLGHLAATRPLGSLSLGEARRLELVSWLTQVRAGQMVLLDEPGMGLHGRERLDLAALLHELVGQGNTVLTADPAREFLEAAHRWLLLGPGGGPDGGRVVAQGERDVLPEESWDADPSQRGAGEEALRFRGLRARHLAIGKLSLPLRRVVAVSGVSGSGKSTLLEEELLPRLRAGRGFAGTLPAGGVSVLLERALRSSPYSTVATLAGAWQEVRRAFADGEEGRIRGLAPGDLVARAGRGGCAVCAGRGRDAGVPCAACDGLGLREDLLALRLRGRSLREWLRTPLRRLEKRLPARGRLRAVVRHLVALGLGDRALGERGALLSLGERGRIALARALAAARAGRPRLFLLDEPCLGLPIREARHVLALLRALSEEGHSFWVVEHHEYLLRGADWLVELGPGAGEQGGRCLFAGTPHALERADTPTALWLRERRTAARPPFPPRPAPRPRSRALADGFARPGRAVLEAALLRELATRSPLLQDALAGSLPQDRDDAGADGALPVAWPAAPAPATSLAAVLGCAEPLERWIREHGAPACRACGGGGPWRDLEEAARTRAGAAAWVLAVPVPAALRARPEHPQWLAAAGFRRIVRGAEARRLRRTDEALREGDAVWLDRLSLEEEDAVPRLRDAEHHAGLLGGGRVLALPPERLDAPAWSYRAGACRDCDREAGTALQIAGVTAGALRTQPLDRTLALLEDHAAPDPLRARLRAQLAGTGLGARGARTPWSSLGELERRVARVAGFLVAPVAGLTLLFDQPLAGLPAPLARRLAAAMEEPHAGAFVWTDAEGHARAAPPPGGAGGRRPPQPAEGDGTPPRLAGRAPQPHPLAFDWEAWCDPPRARPEHRVRRALGLEAPLRAHYLRTEAARLRGLGAAELDPRRGGLACAACRGSGARAVHPQVAVPCAACRGRGWVAGAGELEDRGLRWTELGATPLAVLAEHFAGAPRLAAPLAAAVALGCGAAPLDAPLRVLPLAARTLLPLAAACAGAAPGAGGHWHVGLALAGLDVLEARRTWARIDGILPDGVSLEWRELHPALPR